MAQGAMMLGLNRFASAGTCAVALCAAILTSPHLHADASSGADNALEEVVVTASRTQQRVFDSPVSLSVIGQRELAHSISYGLADVLRDVPGLRVTDSGQPGLKRIRIRGEESRRTAILVNSQEVTDHHEVGVPLTLHPAMVERIEVVRGSGAVLYGSRALSGVVNFITRKGGTKPIQATVSADYNSATGGYDGFASVYGNVEGFEYRVAYSEGDHGDRKTPENTIENTSFDNNNSYLFLGKNFGAHRLEYNWEKFESSSEVFVEDEVRTTFPLTDFYIETPRRDRDKHAIAYQWELDGNWLKSLQANAFQQTGDRLFYTRTQTVWYERDIHNDSELTTNGALLQLNSQELGNHKLIAGLQYLDDSVDQTRYVDTLSWTPPTPSGQEVISDKASIQTTAWFVQDRWSVSDEVAITAGLRHYFVEGKLDYTDRESLQPGKLDDDDELIGALGVVWEYSDSTRLRANVSQGYVYPSLMQLATGAYAGSRFVNPSLDLKPETSVNYETGLRYQGEKLVLDTALFYTESEDYIHHLPCTVEDECPGSRDRKYQNIGKSHAYGLEVYAALEQGLGQVTPYANLTWMQRRNEYETFASWDSGIPELSGRAGLRWAGNLPVVQSSWADLYLRGETSSSLEEPGTTRAVLEDKDSWVTLNVAAGLDLGQRSQYQLALELQNLTDKSYITSTENLYAPERSLAVKLTIDW
jgi:hemoglobin/transferrin/lactoferrin receptor protein